MILGNPQSPGWGVRVLILLLSTHQPFPISGPRVLYALLTHACPSFRVQVGVPRRGCPAPLSSFYCPDLLLYWVNPVLRPGRGDDRCPSEQQA